MEQKMETERMRRTHRDSPDILSEIMMLCSSGAQSTTISRKVGIPYKKTRQSISKLLKVKFLESEMKDGRTEYKTTPLGYEFIGRYNVVRRYMSTRPFAENPIGMEEISASELNKYDAVAHILATCQYQTSNRVLLSELSPHEKPFLDHLVRSKLLLESFDKRRKEPAYRTLPVGIEFLKSLARCRGLLQGYETTNP